MTTEQTLCAPPAPTAQKPVREPVQPVLEKLFSLYPHLFGAKFLPLKLGIFQELLAAHPQDFQRDTLKAALGLHTRSTRYLQCVAARKPRHDLLGNPVEDVAPEHVYLAIIELFRRRQSRSNEDLGGSLRAHLVEAIEASGLAGADYLAKMQTLHPHGAAEALDDAVADIRAKQARQEALVKAFESSGKTPQGFAEMYGLRERDVQSALSAHLKANLTAPASAP